MKGKIVKLCMALVLSGNTLFTNVASFSALEIEETTDEKPGEILGNELEQAEGEMVGEAHETNDEQNESHDQIEEENQNDMQNPINEEQQNDIQHLVDEEQQDQVHSKTNEEPQNSIYNQIDEEQPDQIHSKTNEEPQNDIYNQIDEEQPDQIHSKTNEEPQNDIYNRINEEKQSDIQNEHDIASGTLGSSKWRIDSDGVLYIGGGDFYLPTGFSPWDSYKNVINKIVFEDVVQASGVLNSFFVNLSKVQSIENFHLFDTSRVHMVNAMFENMFDLTSLDLSNFDTSRVTSMNLIFSFTSRLTTLDLSNFDTSAVTDMRGMFVRTGATTLDLSSFDTRAVTDMGMMFYGIKAPTLDVSHFNTSAVLDMSGMFLDANELTTLDIRNFDTSAVTDMSNMFSGTRALTTLDVRNFNTSSVTNMTSMFSGTRALTKLDLSNFDTSSVTNMSGMFSGASALTTLDLRDFDTSAVTNMSFMFSGAKALKTLDLRNFDTSAVTNMSNMFLGITALSSLTLGPDFHFHSDAGLPEIEANDMYTGYWQNIGKGTAKNPQGEYVFTSAELMDQYDGTKMADTFVWQPRHPIPAKYVLDGENVVINIKDIDENLDILSLANVTAVNENDDTEIVTPIVLENNIDKDKAGVYEVYFGIENDNTVQKKIKVFVVDDSTIIDADYIVYANDFDFNFTERKNLTEKLVKQLGHIQAFEISTGNPLHEYVHIDTNDLSVIHEMDKPQVCLINLQLDTETRKILQGTIRVNLVDDRGNDSINGEENDPTKDDPTKDDMGKDDTTKEDPTEDDITKDNTVSTAIKEKQTEESTIADKETLSSKEKNNEKENPKNNLPKTNEQTIHPFLGLPFLFGSLILYFWKKRQKFTDHKRAK